VALSQYTQAGGRAQPRGPAAAAAGLYGSGGNFAKTRGSA